MANNEDDDLDFDLDMDFEDSDFGSDDFDFEPKPVEDNRSPVLKSAEKFKDRFKESLLNETNIRRALTSAMPDEINESITIVDNTLTGVNSAYHDTVKKLKPTVRELKRSARGLKKALGGVLPERVDKWLDAALEDGDSSSSTPSEEEMFENSIKSTMAEIFKVQEEQRGEERQEDKAMSIASMRQQGETLNATGQILKHISHMRTVGDTVGVAVQKKMLELSMRQLRVQNSIFKKFSDHSDRAISALDDIRKNTALPDIVKRQNKELFKDIMLRKFIDNTQESISSKLNLSGQLNRMTKHVFGKISEKVVDPLNELLGQLPMAFDAIGQMKEMEDGMGFGPSVIESNKDKTYKMFAGMAGDIAASKLYGALGGRVKSLLEKNPRVAEKMIQLATVQRRASRSLNGFFRDGLDDPSEDSNFLYKGLVHGANKLREFADLDELAVRESSGTIKYHTAGNLHQSAEFNNFTQKSITEIIPGYLSRILQSSEGIRTGKVPSRIVFDHARDTFVTVKDMERDALGEISSYRSSLTDSLDKFKTNLLGDESTLTKDEEFSLRRYITRTARSGENFDYKELLDSTSLPDSLKEKIRQKQEEQFGVDEEGNLKLDGDIEKRKKYQSLVNAFNNIDLQGHRFNATILDRAKEGVEYTDIMKQLGFVAKDGINSHAINANNIYDFLLQLEEQQEQPTTSNASFRGRRHVKRTKTPTPASRVLGGSSASRDAGHRVSLPSATLEHISSIQQSTLQIHKLLESHFVEKLNEEYNQAATGKLEKIDDSINGQTIALLQAIDKLNTNIAHIGQMSAREQGVEWTPTDIRPDEITSNLINWNKLARYGRETASAGVDFIKNAYNITTNTTKSVWGFTRDNIAAPVARLLEKGKNRLLTMDLYFPNNLTEPVVKARDFALGKYVDIHGNVVESLSDVKSNLYKIAEDGSLQLVVTIDELQNHLVNRYGEFFDITRYSSLTKNLLSGAGDLLKQGASYLNPMGVVNKAKSFVEGAYLRAKELIMKDVYVGTEQIPRITGVQLMTGAFLCNGKPIFRAKDITDDVYDRNGNLVLSLEEARTKGLFDVKGNPYRDILDNAIHAVGNVLGFGMGLGKGALDKIRGFGRSVFDFGKNIVSGIFGGMEFSLDVNSKWTKRIYELLVWRFGGKPPHHEDDITNDDLTAKTSAFKDKAEKSIDTAKEAMSSLFGEVGQKASDVTDTIKASGVYKQATDAVGKVKTSLETSKAKIYDDALSLSKSGKSSIDKGINYLTTLLGGGKFVDFDHLPKDLQIAIGQHHMHAFDKLFKNGPNNSVLVNLKLAMQLESKRLKQVAASKGYPIGDHRNESYMSAFLRKIKRQAKDDDQSKISKILGGSIITDKKEERKQAAEERVLARKRSSEERKAAAKQRILDRKLSRKEREERGIKGKTNRFTGALRANAWWAKGRNTNAGKKEEKKPQEAKKPQSMLGKLLGLVGAIAGSLLPAVVKGIAGLPGLIAKTLGGLVKGVGTIAKLAGRATLGVGKFAYSAVTGKGASIAGKALHAAGRVAGRAAVQVVARAATGLLTTPAGWAAIAVVAAGYLAYKAWRFFRDAFEEVDEYRLAAYGINANNDASKSNKILAFEKELAEQFKIDKFGKVVRANIDYEKWSAFFWDENVDGELSVDRYKQEQLPRFKDWYVMRFLPSYIKFREALFSMTTAGIDKKQWSNVNGLYDIDSDMEDGFKPAFVRMTLPRPEDQIDGLGIGYYDYEGLPFSDMDTGGLSYPHVKEYAMRVISAFEKDENVLKNWKYKEMKDSDGRFTFEANFLEREDAGRKDEKGESVWKETTYTDDKGKAHKRAYIPGDKVELVDSSGNKKVMSLEEASKLSDIKVTSLSDYQVFRISAYGMLSPFIPEEVLLVLQMEQEFSKKYIRVDSKDAGVQIPSLSITKEDRLAFVKKHAIKFGYDIEKQEDISDFDTYLEDRFIPINLALTRMMMSNNHEDKIAVGDFDKLNTEQLYKALGLGWFKDEWKTALYILHRKHKPETSPVTIEWVVKNISAPTLFKGRAMNTTLALMERSAQNIKDEKKSVPLAIPKTASERKAHADKIRGQIEKEIERQRKEDEKWGVNRGDPASDKIPSVSPNNDYSATNSNLPKNLDYNSGQPTGELKPGKPLTSYGDAKSLAEVIASHESKGNYNIYNQGAGHGYKTGTAQFDKMSVGEVLKLQHLSKTHPDKLFATGKYQVIPKTLSSIVADKNSGISASDKYDAVTQDKILAYLLKRNRPAAYAFITGKSTDIDKTINSLAYEWASLQKTDGRGAYDGDGINTAHTKVDDVRNALLYARERYQKLIADGISPEMAFMIAITGKKEGEDSAVRDDSPMVGTDIPAPTDTSNLDSKTDTTVKTDDVYSPRNVDTYVNESDTSGIDNISGNGRSVNTSIPTVQESAENTLRIGSTSQTESTYGALTSFKLVDENAPAPVVEGDSSAVTERARKAAAYAERRFGNKKPEGKCAWGVRTILEEGGGYKLNPNNRDRSSAYMYHENNILKESGFTLVGKGPKNKPLIGDVLVWMPYKTFGKGGRVHGHIQIWTGTKWISDGAQMTVYPNSSKANLFDMVPCYHYRDMDSSIKPEFSEAEIDDSKQDGGIFKSKESPMGQYSPLVDNTGVDNGYGPVSSDIASTMDSGASTLSYGTNMDSGALQPVPPPVSHAPSETLSLPRVPQTELLNRTMTKEIVKCDVMNLAKTEELLSRQVKLQEDNNKLVSDILSVLSQSKQNTPVSNNTNVAKGTQKETTSGQGGQSRSLNEPLRTGPIKTTV